MPRLGQHFLTDKNALKKIAGFLDLSAEGGSASGGKGGDTIVEIGPGHGELTEQIANSQSQIVAIEKDELLANALREKFSGNEKIKIITGDILKILSSLIENCKLSARGGSAFSGKIENYKLAGNIPYYITGKLLRTISELPEKPEISVFTIQKEVAERLVAKPRGMNPVRSRPRQQASATGTSGRPASNGMNRLAASVQFWAEPEIALIIPRDSFRPIPDVDSATIVLKKGVQRGIKTDAYYKTVRVLFSQPRKTILNNLSFGMGVSKKDAEEKLKLARIESGLRPQNLSVEDIIKIAVAFQ